MTKDIRNKRHDVTISQEQFDVPSPFGPLSRHMFGVMLQSTGGGTIVPLREQDDDQTHTEYDSRYGASANITSPILLHNGPALGAVMDSDPDGGVDSLATQWPYLLTTAAYWNDVPGHVNPVVYNGENYDWTERTRQVKVVNVNLRKSLAAPGELTPDTASRASSPGELFVRRMASYFGAP